MDTNADYQLYDTVSKSNSNKDIIKTYMTGLGLIRGSNQMSMDLRALMDTSITVSFDQILYSGTSFYVIFEYHKFIKYVNTLN